MISDRFHDVAARHPDVVAIVDGGERITYSDLARRQAAFLDLLTGKLRLGEGDIAAVSLPNCWQFAACFLAVAEAGAIFLPLNTQWRAEEIAAVTGRLPVSLVITTQGLFEPWQSLLGGFPPDRIVPVDGESVQQALEAHAGKTRRKSKTRLLEDEAAVYFSTSGSTGRPRVAARSHRNLIAGANNVADALDIATGMRLLSVVPFYHANGFSNCMLLPLVSGATAVLMRRFTPGKLVDVVQREAIQVLIAPPFIYSMLVDRAPGSSAFRTVEICLSSGAPMSPGLATECEERLGLRVRQLYGSSESGTLSIASGDEPLEDGSVGAPLPSVRIRVLAKDGSELPAGETGEIAVRSPAMMAGYVGEPELNRRMFRDGFFRMGDLGHLDAKGNLVLSGRIKRVINVAGIKVDPREIERVLETMPGVRQVHAQGVENTKGAEVIQVRIVMRLGAEASRRDVILHCRQHLAEHKIPRVIEFVSEIPVNAAGKQPLAGKASTYGFSRS